MSHAATRRAAASRKVDALVSEAAEHHAAREAIEAAAQASWRPSVFRRRARHEAEP
jgi:ABC-type sugar transport system substrate-binding protein